MNNLFLGKDPHMISHVVLVYDYNYAVQVVRSDKVLSKIPVSSYDHSIVFCGYS